MTSAVRGVIAEALPALAPRMADALARYGPALRRKLGSSPADLARIERFYIPVFAFVEQQLAARPPQGPGPGQGLPPPVVIGLSAPQGCGKTTLAESLREALELSGRSCVSLSLDDFYLTGADQDALAAAHADNEILQCRGNGKLYILYLNAN
jgi:D-glycerate 3-kinase